jgi:hypothetical protein
MYETLRAGRYVNLTATADVTTGGPSALIGFYVNSTNAGTLVLKDGGSSGTAITGTITPAIGWHFLPVQASGSGIHATIAGTALNVTFVIAVPG